MKLKTVANVVREIKSATREVVSKMLRYYAAGMMTATVKKTGTVDTVSAMHAVKVCK